MPEFRSISFAAGALFVLSAASAQTSLPPAPSSVLSAPPAVQAQYAVGPRAGSGKTFTAGSTYIGPGGLPIERAQVEPLRLSIDDAISLALDRNLRLQFDRANLRIVKGDRLQVANALIPALSLNASSSTQEVNLAAMGFKPQNLTIPGFTGTIATIVKVDVTQALVNVNQQLFNLPAYELFRGAKDETDVVTLNTLAARGDLVVAVGTAYLQLLADMANLENNRALEATSQKLYDDAVARRDAGVGTSLDVLRAKVELQNRQQVRVNGRGVVAKEVIQLDRILGLPAEQKLILTDTAPYVQLADMDIDRAKAVAFQRRRDYLSVLAQVRVAERERLAVKYQRLPTIAFGGYYGVLGETEGLYHGVFRAAGSLNFPIFREAGQRGDTEVITAQLMNLRQREASLRIDIEAQLRSAMLDVNAGNELVKVAQSNLALSQQQLADEQDRFAAGIDTSLPVVDAQATLAGSQAKLVDALNQFNRAKLQLARATGIVESQYRTYLGTSTP